MLYYIFSKIWIFKRINLCFDFLCFSGCKLCWWKWIINSCYRVKSWKKSLNGIRWISSNICKIVITVCVGLILNSHQSIIYRLVIDNLNSAIAFFKLRIVLVVSRASNHPIISRLISWGEAVNVACICSIWICMNCIACRWYCKCWIIAGKSCITRTVIPLLIIIGIG